MENLMQVIDLLPLESCRNLHMLAIDPQVRFKGIPGPRLLGLLSQPGSGVTREGQMLARAFVSSVESSVRAMAGIRPKADRPMKEEEEKSKSE